MFKSTIEQYLFEAFIKLLNSEKIEEGIANGTCIIEFGYDPIKTYEEGEEHENVYPYLIINGVKTDIKL